MINKKPGIPPKKIIIHPLKTLIFNKTHIFRKYIIEIAKIDVTKHEKKNDDVPKISAKSDRNCLNSEAPTVKKYPVSERGGVSVTIPLYLKSIEVSTSRFILAYSFAQKIKLEESFRDTS